MRERFAGHTQGPFCSPRLALTHRLRVLLNGVLGDGCTGERRWRDASGWTESVLDRLRKQGRDWWQKCVERRRATPHLCCRPIGRAPQAVAAPSGAVGGGAAPRRPRGGGPWPGCAPPVCARPPGVCPFPAGTRAGVVCVTHGGARSAQAVPRGSGYGVTWMGRPPLSPLRDRYVTGSCRQSTSGRWGCHGAAWS